MCLYPKLIKNRKYTANKKNGGQVPPVKDDRVKYVPVGCGNCIECRKQKAREWQVRLLEDIKEHKNGKFITLTLSNESIANLCSEIKDAQGYELDNAVATLAVRRFLERWRKKHTKSLRHWLVTELGHNGTENIHLHGIVYTEESYTTIRDIWNYGFIWPRPESNTKTFVNGKTINYIVKYVNKIDTDHQYYKSIILTSPGIGGNYAKSYDFKQNKYNGTETIETYRTSTGHKIAMPIYWRNKAYQEEEREKLWLQKLDKNERWVCGTKVKADNHEEYWKLVQYHRQRNTKLGYGNDEKSWDRQQYEENRRKLLTEKRIQNGILNNSKNTTRTTKTRKTTNEKQNGKNHNT